MKLLSLLMWVTQLGFSIMFPLCFFLLLANWLRQKYGLGLWIMIVFGVLGLLTSISSARSCVRSVLKAADEASSGEEPPISFNDHE